MKSVLMVAYFFPPEGNAGAFRPLRFVRHLPGHGWNPTVLTMKTDDYERYDPSLLDQVPIGVNVERVPNWDPWRRFLSVRRKQMRHVIARESLEVVANIQAAHLKPVRSYIRSIVRKLEARAYHPDLAMGWIKPAVKTGVDLCISNQTDVVWATAGPVSSFVVASRISQILGIPYVLDFRDAWTLTYNEFEESRPVWLRRADRRAMFRLLKNAQSVVFRYESEAESFWRAYRGVFLPTDTYIIPNGYEGTIDSSDAKPRDRCTILYSGTLSSYRYDTLLTALEAMRASQPNLFKFLKLRFVGEESEALSGEAHKRGLDEVISATGHVPQDEITRLSNQADALLLLGRPPTMRGFELIAGAKLFGYLKAGRPIVGILPADESRNTLLRVGVTTTADADSIDDIVNVLCKVVDRWLAADLSSLLPNRMACQAYSADSQTDELVRALSRKPAARPFRPGSVEVPQSLRDEIAICSSAVRSEIVP